MQVMSQSTKHTISFISHVRYVRRRYIVLQLGNMHQQINQAYRASIWCRFPIKLGLVMNKGLFDAAGISLDLIVKFNLINILC